jgi:general secretion pathway protein K
MPMNNPLRTSQTHRGSALISALFIMTLVAIAATAMNIRVQRDIYRTHLMINSNKLYLAAQSITFWGMDTLLNQHLPAREKKKGAGLLSYPKELEHVYPSVSMKGTLYDLQGSFNLNNLKEKRFLPIFSRLLKTSFKNPEKIKSQIASIQYWISPYDPERGHHDELNYYQKRWPPDIPGYQPLQSVSELRLVRGMTDTTYKNLLPYITALPEVTPINLNTASKQVLMTLGNGLTESQVIELLNARGQEGIENIQKIAVLLQKLEIPNEQITLESNYYLCIATASTPDSNLTLYTVMKRKKNQQKKMSVSIISQSIQTM